MFGQELIIVDLDKGRFILLFYFCICLKVSVIRISLNEAVFLHCLGKRLMIYSKLKEAAN